MLTANQDIVKMASAAYEEQTHDTKIAKKDSNLLPEITNSTNEKTLENFNNKAYTLSDILSSMNTLKK
jgi:hypothetical protein